MNLKQVYVCNSETLMCSFSFCLCIIGNTVLISMPITEQPEQTSPLIPYTFDFMVLNSRLIFLIIILILNQFCTKPNNKEKMRCDLIWIQFPHWWMFYLHLVRSSYASCCLDPYQVHHVFSEEECRVEVEFRGRDNVSSYIKCHRFKPDDKVVGCAPLSDLLSRTLTPS